MENNIKEDGECGIGAEAAPGMGTDILGGGSELPNELGVLGKGNFNFPKRIGKLKKRLLEDYEKANKI